MREMRCTAVGKGRRRVGRRWKFVMSLSEMGLEGQAHVQSRTRGFRCPGMVVCAAVCGRARSFTSGTLSRQRLSQLISSCFMNHIAPNRHRFWPGLESHARWIAPRSQADLLLRSFMPARVVSLMLFGLCIRHASRVFSRGACPCRLLLWRFAKASMYTPCGCLPCTPAVPNARHHPADPCHAHLEAGWRGGCSPVKI